MKTLQFSEQREGKLANMVAPYLRMKTTSGEIPLSRGAFVRVVFEDARDRVLIYRKGDHSASHQEGEILLAHVRRALQNLYPDMGFDLQITGPHQGKQGETPVCGYAVEISFVKRQPTLFELPKPQSPEF